LHYGLVPASEVHTHGILRSPRPLVALRADRAFPLRAALISTARTAHFRCAPRLFAPRAVLI